MENLGFWSVAALLSLGVAGLLIAASLRGRAEAGAAASAPSDRSRDMQVYRDQLAEVDRDLARGTLDAAEGQRLRAEIARRLLEADRKQQAGAAAPGKTGGWIAAGAVALAMAGAVLVYTRIGLPGYPDLPIADRLAEADQAMKNRPSQADWVARLPVPALPQPDAEFLALMDKLRAAVDPASATDTRGLDLLARNEAALGNYAAAIAAQQRLIAVKGDAATADDHAGLAEILITQAQGYVSPEAEQALLRALQIEPSNGLARYYGGLMFSQGGRYDRAMALWAPLLEESPADAPWVGPLRAQIEEVAALAGIRYSLPPVKGPSAEDVAAAGDMTEADRQAMIEGMVQQLSDRLAAEGGSPEEYAQLMTALTVLGRMDEARAALAQARESFKGDATALATIEEAASVAGIAP
jgi:cytochrome c-type biogenesis protein CcmH